MNWLRASWRRICRFFVDPEFDAQMAAHEAQADALIRHIESRRREVS